MLFGKNLLAFVPALAGLAAASSGLEERDVCINLSGPIIQVYITTQVVNVPVLINTFVPSNGVITVGGTTISVNNAPTQVITVINTPTTQTNSQTATVTVGPNGVSTQVGPTINIINFPVVISTFVQQNTIINVQGATIIVNNAPTTITTTATGTITQTTTTTSTVTSNVPLATVLVQVSGPVAPGVKRVRRQTSATGFLAADGSLSSTCSAAVPLVIVNGQLIVDRTANLFSANTTDTVITFAASSVVRPINTVFSYTANNGLAWTNSAFAGGRAVFFVQNNFLRAQLQGTAPVGGAALQVIAASRCVNGQIVPATTSTSTTSAATSTSTGSSSTLTSTSTSTSSLTSITSVLTTFTPVGTTTIIGSTTVLTSTNIPITTTTILAPTTPAATTTTTAAAPPVGF